MATYGGVNIFGRSVRIAHTIDPSAGQINEFFGINGQQHLWGGFRGRVFFVEGVLFGANQAALTAAEALWIGGSGVVGDGIARTLVDTVAVSWPYVLAISFEQKGRRIFDGRGLYLPYKAAFKGLV